ncbi:MAG: hypothetical protein ACK53Z_17130 [Betaproteobacteria bacterium]|nr:hypothetical protein [Betaproteobacteria bacterium]
MSVETISTTGVGLMLLLGFRHGLDPDHVAVIDALTLHCSRTRPAVAPWTGTLFSIGHGILITIVAVLVSLVNVPMKWPVLVQQLAGWLPVALLAAIGIANLVSLLRTRTSASATPVLRLAGPLARAGNPSGIIAAGVVFALVFDTASQAAAWGYVANAQGGVPAALLAGVAFTAGMIIPDTLDSRLLFGILRNADEQSRHAFRRALGWCIVALSLLMAGAGAALRISPELMPEPNAWTLVGATLVAPVVGVYAWLIWRLRSAPHARPGAKP